MRKCCGFSEVAEKMAAAASPLLARWLLSLFSHSLSLSYLTRAVKILKRKKAIDFKGVFLMYPMHKDEIVTLKDETYIEKVKEAASD